MTGHRTALLFSGILSMVCARAAIPTAFDEEPQSGRHELVERPLHREGDLLIGASGAQELNRLTREPGGLIESLSRKVDTDGSAATQETNSLASVQVASIPGASSHAVLNESMGEQAQGQLEGQVISHMAKFLPQYNLMRLDGSEIDPEAARLLFNRVQTTARANKPQDVIGCYEVVQDRLRTLNCLDALKGSLNPASSRTYYVELAGLPTASN